MLPHHFPLTRPEGGMLTSLQTPVRRCNDKNDKPQWKLDDTTRRGYQGKQELSFVTPLG